MSYWIVLLLHLLLNQFKQITVLNFFLSFRDLNLERSETGEMAISCRELLHEEGIDTLDLENTTRWTWRIQHVGPGEYNTLDLENTTRWTWRIQHVGPGEYNTLDLENTTRWTWRIQHVELGECNTLDLNDTT